MPYKRRLCSYQEQVTVVVIRLWSQVLVIKNVNVLETCLGWKILPSLYEVAEEDGGKGRFHC